MNRLPVQGDLALVVGRAASQQQAILVSRFERRRLPEVDRIDRLDVVMAVEENRRFVRRLQPVGIDHRVPAGLDHRSVLEPYPLVLLGEMAGRPTDVL